MSDSIQFKSDPEFDVLFQPYSEEAKEKIRQQICADITCRVVHTWGDKYLLNHITYDLLNEMEIPVIYKKHSFNKKIEAALYICITQARRPDLTSRYKKFLIGREYYYRTIIEKETSIETNTKCRLSTLIGTKYDITGCSVYRYSNVAKAICDIYSKNQAMALFILMDKCTIAHETVIELSRLKADQIHAVYKAVCDKTMPRISPKLIHSEANRLYKEKCKSHSQHDQEKKSCEKAPAIRQMPAYDPDAEVNSLCMTIDYWVTSIQRVNNKVKLNHITTDARIRLMKKLSFLDNSSGSLQKSLVERINA